MKRHTVIRIEPIKEGFEYKVRLYGVNFGGGWAADVDMLGHVLSALLLDLPRVIAEDRARGLRKTKG